MSSLKFSRATFGETHWPAVEAARHLAALLLGSASVALARLAAHLLQSAAPVAETESHLEFHAGPDEPEGALYLDGRLVAWIVGVKRL